MGYNGLPPVGPKPRPSPPPPPPPRRLTPGTSVERARQPLDSARETRGGLGWGLIGFIVGSLFGGDSDAQG